MMIEHIVLENFKNYPGTNTFDWTISGDRNVILIGGMNGAGKTTISEGIKLCLYGSKMNGTPLTEAKYNAYLLSVWNKRNLTDRMSISLDIEIDSDSGPIEMTIQRAFVKRKDSIKESFSLTKNGQDVELVDRNYWEYYISKILPAHISRYYFFDGETIRDTIASDSSSEYLYSAIRDLTGVSQLDILRNDLLEVRKRISRSNMKPSLLKSIKNVEDQIEGCRSFIVSLESQMNEQKAKRESILSQKEVVAKELNRAVGVRDKEDEALSKRLEESKIRLSELNEYIYDFVYSNYPRLICAGVLEKTLQAAKAENDSNISSLSSDFLKSKIQEINSLIDDKVKTKDKNKIASLKESIEKILISNSDGSTVSDPIVDLTYRQIESLRSYECSEDAKYLFINRLREKQDLELGIADIQHHLSRHADESVEEFRSKLATLEEGIAACDSEIIGITAVLESKNEEIETLLGRIRDYEKQLTLSNRDHMALKVIDETIENIDMRIRLKLADGVRQFEEDVNFIYAALSNKDDMVKHISVDSDFLLRLEGFDDLDVKVKLISEGEKGILMYSVMYGLINISESKLPLIIDSPLGRMDSEHVRNLIERLYPIFGNQVVILSHDREITPDMVPLLDSVMSRKYLINRSGEPKVEEGYFR